MKMYLSSYKLGNEKLKLSELIESTNGKIGYIPNALDFTGADPARKEAQITENMSEIDNLGAKSELIDLKKYFGKSEELKQKISELGGLYIQGGNTFVLRQAMKLSGLDEILIGLREDNNFLYIAYSAGVCLLSPDLKAYAITDNANDFPYSEIQETVWEGLNLITYYFEPHYKSDHPESASTDKEIAYCIENKQLFKAFRDGEVLIIE